MRKKILLFIDGMNSGGAQRQMIGLAKYLQNSSEYEIRLLFYKTKADFYNTQLNQLGIHYVYDVSSKSNIHGFITLRKQIKDFHPDLIISFLGESNLFASVNKLICHIPLIVSERNTTIIPTKFDKIRFFLYRYVDKIIPNSYSQAQYLCQHYKKITEKVTPIINFVDTDLYCPCKTGKMEKRKNIIIVARVVPQKNVLNFISAIKEVTNRGLKDFHINWIGSLASSNYVESCKQTIDKLQLNDYISFIGECQNMTSVYQQADAFCLPSFHEGTPNVICEAMACGLPILCSNVCDNSRYVKDGENGFLFNPNNINSMTEVIQNFLMLPTENLINMGILSRNIAVENFSISKFNAMWHKQIKQLIK